MLAWMADQTAERQVTWLPNERFEIALDARLGALTRPGGSANTLTVTSQRAIRVDTRSGRRRTLLLPLSRITAIEVVDVSRPSERLTQGLIVLGAGFVLVWISWVVFATALVSLLVGGIPVLVGVYVLAGYAFPDGEGELVLHASGLTLRQPVLSADARRDAYVVAHRIAELAAGAGPAEPDAAAVPEAALVADDVAAPEPDAAVAHEADNIAAPEPDAAVAHEADDAGAHEAALVAEPPQREPPVPESVDGSGTIRSPSV